MNNIKINSFPICEYCNQIKDHICLELICQQKGLLCFDCQLDIENSSHFLHQYQKINDIFDQREQIIQQIVIRLDNFLGNHLKMTLAELQNKIKYKMNEVKHLEDQYLMLKQYRDNGKLIVQQIVHNDQCQQNKWNLFKQQLNFIQDRGHINTLLIKTIGELKKYCMDLQPIKKYLTRYQQQWQNNSYDPFRQKKSQFELLKQIVLNLQYSHIMPKISKDIAIISSNYGFVGPFFRIPEETRILVLPSYMNNMHFPNKIVDISIRASRISVSQIIENVKDLNLMHFKLRGDSNMPIPIQKMLYLFAISHRLRTFSFQTSQQDYNYKNNLYRVLFMHKSNLNFKSKTIRRELLEVLNDI